MNLRKTLYQFVVGLAIVLSCLPAYAASKATCIEFLLSQVRQTTGNLAGGTVTVAAAGDATSTPITIWQDRNKATPAANPYTLDANGTAQIYADGLIKVVIKNAAGSTVYTRDNLSYVDYLTSGSYQAIDSDYASLNAAITAIGATPTTLLIRTASFPMTGAAVVPATLSIKVEYPGSIANSTYALSGAGMANLTAHNSGQVFTGTGTVTGLSESRPEWFATSATLTTAGQAAIQRAASALTSGGTLLLTGSYALQAYDAGQAEANYGIALLDNTHVKGMGKGKTVLTSNGISNWFFHADNKTNIKISDLSVQKGNVLYMATGGSNVTIDNISASGYTSDDATHLLGSEGVRLYGVDGLRVSNSEFIDYNVGIELFAYSSTATKNVTITKNTFKHLDGHHGTYWENPVGLYLVNTDNVKVTENTFLNIYPGDVSSHPATAMGYGFYAGDGAGVQAVANTTIAHNHFEYNEAGLDLDFATHALLWANSGKWSSIGNVYKGAAGVIGGGTDVKSIGDVFDGSYLVIYKADNATVQGGTFRDAPTTASAIKFGQNTDSVGVAIAQGNTIYAPGRSGIVFEVAGKGVATGNIITAPNTSATSLYDAIFFSSCFTGTSTGNVITQGSTGQADYGIRMSSTNKDHIVYGNNVIEGMLLGRMVGSYYTLPTRGLWYAGDEITYQGGDGVLAGYPDGFKVIFSLDTTLSASRTTGNTSMAVTSGTGTVNGDIIGVLLDSGSWHWTTIASGGGTTTIVLTSGLPSAATSGAKVHVFRAISKFGSIGGTYADNTAALAGGLSAGMFYRTSTGQVQVVY